MSDTTDRRRKPFDLRWRSVFSPSLDVSRKEALASPERRQTAVKKTLRPLYVCIPLKSLIYNCVTDHMGPFWLVSQVGTPTPNTIRCLRTSSWAFVVEQNSV